MQLGIQLYSLGAELDADFNGTLQQVAAIGYKDVELAQTYGKSAAELRAAFSDLGLVCRSAHMWDFRQTPQQFMDFAKEVGAGYVVTSFNPPPHMVVGLATENPDFGVLLRALESMTADDYKKSAEVANSLGEEAQKRGLVYAYHNHNLEFIQFDGETAIELILRESNPATVKFELDCGWAAAAGFDPVELMKRYSDRVRLLHIKGFKPGAPSLKMTGEGKPIPTELKRGLVDYKSVFTQAEQVGVVHCFVEQEPPFVEMSAMETVKADFEYLRSLGVGGAGPK